MAAKKPDSKVTVDSVKKALDRITQMMSPMSPELVKALLREIDGKHGDRGPAILIATSVENALDVAIAAAMKLSENHSNYALRGRGVLAEFYAKIELGKMLGIYDAETYNNLDLIRCIRNAFAHAKVALSFTTPEVEAVCSFLKLPSARHTVVGPPRPHPPGFSPTGEQLYRTVVRDITYNLHWWAFYAIKEVSSDRLKNPQVGYFAFEKRMPLP
jgi:hypothetical protein